MPSVDRTSASPKLVVVGRAGKGKGVSTVATPEELWNAVQSALESASIIAVTIWLERDIPESSSTPPTQVFAGTIVARRIGGLVNRDSLEVIDPHKVQGGDDI